MTEPLLDLAGDGAKKQQPHFRSCCLCVSAVLASSRISRAALPSPGIARRRKPACARSLLLFKSNLRFDLSCGSFRLFCSVPFARLGWRRGKKTAAAFLQLPSLCQRRAIFPGRRQPSIVATDELNFRVRNGNGWTLIVIGTDFEVLCALRRSAHSKLNRGGGQGRLEPAVLANL